MKEAGWTPSDMSEKNPKFMNIYTIMECGRLFPEVTIYQTGAFTRFPRDIYSYKWDIVLFISRYINTVTIDSVLFCSYDTFFVAVLKIEFNWYPTNTTC